MDVSPTCIAVLLSRRRYEDIKDDDNGVVWAQALKRTSFLQAPRARALGTYRLWRPPSLLTSRHNVAASQALRVGGATRHTWMINKVTP